MIYILTFTAEGGRGNGGRVCLAFTIRDSLRQNEMEKFKESAPKVKLYLFFLFSPLCVHFVNFIQKYHFPNKNRSLICIARIVHSSNVWLRNKIRFYR